MEERLNELEMENARLQRLVLELLIKNQKLRSVQATNADESQTLLTAQPLVPVQKENSERTSFV